MGSNESFTLAALGLDSLSSPRPPPHHHHHHHHHLACSLDPMEFLSRSWRTASSSSSAVDVVSRPPTAAPHPRPHLVGPIPEDAIGELEEEEEDGDDDEHDGGDVVAGNPFTFGNTATSQLVMERIMSQSQDVSSLTSGRLSHSSGPLNGGGGSFSDSPPVSPSDIDDYCRAANSRTPHYRASNKTIGRWLKERREKKKEETRAHNAQLHAAVSVAGVAAAVAAISAATAAASGSRKDGRAAKTDVAVASAATLVAAQCVEAAEALGAEREHLAAVVGSAVSVRTPGDVVTLTAAAATALRGAATLKARALKEVWNIAAVIPVEKGAMGDHRDRHHRRNHQQRKDEGPNGEVVPEDNFLSLCSQELLARGTDLLKRTRKGALHWKIVSVYLHRTGVVMLKMKSRHVAGTITKKNKCVISDVCKDVLAWPGRHLLEGGDDRRYFGLKTADQRVIEFECRSQREYEMWTDGVSRLLSIVRENRRVRR